MTKNNGVAHRVLDEISQFKISIETKIGELISKHNQLSSQLVAQEAICQKILTFTAQEIGKSNAHQQIIGQELGNSMAKLDLNVLALAEMTKEIFIEMAQMQEGIERTKRNLLETVGVIINRSGIEMPPELIDSINSTFSFLDSDLSRIKTNALARRTDVMTSAFAVVQDDFAKEERKIAEEIAAKTEEERSKKETASVEKELHNANFIDSGLSIATGGSGSAFPDGAEIFGG